MMPTGRGHARPALSPPPSAPAHRAAAHTEPVSILIGRTQVALARERSAKRLRETFESNLEAFERLRIIVNDMLFLARRDRGERATDLADVSLDDAQLRAELTGDARASVDPPLFGRAMTNLLINAIQHMRAENTIRATSTPRGETVEIAVSHPGEPIDAAARAHLFERAYRIEQARANSDENHGPGLSIVKAVAEMHGGAVFVSCEDGWNAIGLSVAAQPAGTGPHAHDPRPAAAARRPALKTA
ncbi:histidine kinase-, DNA gyrase B-, and HSP90-like ATPase family protein [Burkholderia pseudomallei]|nr:his Kinase A domain protein [Burkholderia pseudomallei B03]AIV94489.1 his Kinase A domain protein [Burkholderia pseudomallei A79A]KGY04306.1 his Kinase A domain protein [Burkholderia pseudomallei A79D]KGY05014.1 his Kinase A domain protein [Burkholderia pseudomallei A79C]CAJ4051449.1 histidine kinase-, DNA gyrase B-, and HSP90-like ATPase family protein [Burkholderia pseudomallei]